MRYVLLEDVAELAALEGAWTSLLRRSGRDSMPLTHFWIKNWWKSFSGDIRPKIHCLYSESKLVGVCPMFFKNSSYRRVAVRKMTSMASSASPYSDVLIDTALLPDEIDGFVAKIVESTNVDITCFLRVPAESAVSGRLQNMKSLGRHAVGVRRVFNTPIIRVDSDWETFFGKRSQKFRKSMRNKVNRFNKTEGCRVERRELASSGDPAVQDMLAVSRNSWKGKAGTDLGTERGSLAFLSGLIDALGPSGGAHVWIAKSGDQPIAYEFHASYAGVTYPLRADFDENFRELAPGSVVEFAALRDVFCDGRFELYDSCANDYWYLSNWTSEFRAHDDIEIFSGGKGRMLHAFEYRLLPMVRAVRARWKKKEDPTRPAASH